MFRNKKDTLPRDRDTLPRGTLPRDTLLCNWYHYCNHVIGVLLDTILWYLQCPCFVYGKFTGTSHHRALVCGRFLGSTGISYVDLLYDCGLAYISLTWQAPWALSTRRASGTYRPLVVTQEEIRI